MRQVPILLGGIGLLLGGATIAAFVAKPSAISKNSINPPKRSASQTALYEEFDRREREAIVAFSEGNYGEARRFYESQEQIPVPRRNAASANSTSSPANLVSVTNQLAACDIAEGKYREALARYSTEAARWPGKLWDIAGRMFYAANLTRDPRILERTLSSIEAATYADPTFFGHEEVESWNPRNPRVLTLMRIARLLAQDRNRAGAEAALDLAQQASDDHPAVLKLRLELLETYFRDPGTFRALASTITSKSVESVPSLQGYHRKAEWFADYERRWPRHWQSLLARERSAYLQQKQEATRTTFAYEVTRPSPNLRP